MELIPGLPNHIALECLIRISFDQFPKAASVCRAWNVMIKDPNFIQRWKASAGWQIAVHYKTRVYRFQMHSPSVEYLRNQIKTLLPDIDINDFDITFSDWDGRNVIAACDEDLAYCFQCLDADGYHIQLALKRKSNSLIQVWLSLQAGKSWKTSQPRFSYAEKPFGAYMRAGGRRVVPSAGLSWVAPESNVDRQLWRSPAMDVIESSARTDDLGKGDMPLHGTIASTAMVPVNESIPAVVMGEQKRKRADESGKAATPKALTKQALSTRPALPELEAAGDNAEFHAMCVDAWLTSWRTFCPVCKRDARTSTRDPPASESTPLLSSSVSLSSLGSV
nr:receptor homology region, transmembrane domain-and RING domain-containing protein 2 [Ipomoea batatas]